MFCMIRIISKYTVYGLIIAEMEIKTWHFSVGTGKIFFNFFHITFFCQCSQLKIMMPDIVTYLSCLFNSRTKIVISGALQRKEMIFLLKPCIFIQT